MAWTAPNTFVAGAVLTSAQLNAMQANALAGGPIFATEALRDAAIAAPFEGQRAYITGSTVAAAVGGTTSVPTGITTVYNGAAWVCTTEVGTLTSNTGTLANSAFTPTLTGSPGTNPAVTVSTGTTALVTISASLVASATMTIQMDVAVSGATTIAAGAVSLQGLYWQTSMTSLAHVQCATFIVTGLTAGANTFTLNYSNNNSSTYAQRRVIAKGIA